MKFFLPAHSADDWKQLLAAPDKHWRTGYSARTLAHSWQSSDGFPAEVRAVLEPAFPGIELLLGLPEHKVPLPGGGRASQTDLWVLARSGNELVSIAVEGKVSEAFGPTVAEWLADASEGKRERLRYLASQLGCGEDIPAATRYQLLHRTASAIIEARRFRARHAVLLVHSFSRANEWLDDFIAFGRLMKVESKPNHLVRVRDCDGIDLSIAWVTGDASFLES